MLSFNEVFDADFLSALSRLSLDVRRVAGGGRHAERLSRDRGGGAEFKDYRPYSPGDDLRAIDWNIYRRLGKLSLRLFEEQQDLPLYFMPDVSGSLFLESPPRIVAGLRATLALAAVGLEGHDSAGLFPFAGQLQVLVKSMSGRASVMAFARYLARLTEAASTRRTNLVDAVRKLAQMKLRPGLLVIVSDFFDPEGIEALGQALRPLRHRLLLIQLVRASDADPVLQGDVRLEDCETGEVTDLSLTPDVLDRYRAAYRAFDASLVALARRRGGRLLRLDVEKDLIGQLSTLFESGSLRV
ncbi:MAG: DUF58 domain-containing protein [Gammaproteobacteria bacterium]